VIRRAAILIAACVGLAVAGCGGGGGESEELASIAPANAPVYFESVVRPEGEQRDAIDSLASRVGGIGDLGGAIVQQLDAQLAQAGSDATYERDIAPWLGERGAFFLTSFGGKPPPMAIALETTDPVAAEAFVQKVAADYHGIKQGTYDGVRFFQGAGEDGTYAVGVIDDALVFAPLDAFKASVDASKGDSLADFSAFEEGTSTLPDDNLVLGYTDGQQAADQLASLSTDPLQATLVKTALQALANGAVTFAVSATPDTATLDISPPNGLAAQLSGGDLVGQAPADAWFAIGVKDLGRVLGDALQASGALPIQGIGDRLKQLSGVDPSDVVAWLQDGYGYVAGTSQDTIAIGGVAQSSDRNASANAIDALRRRFQQDADAKLGPPRLKGADTGFSATAPESPHAIDLAQVGDQVVAALGRGHPGEQALHPTHPLADDPSFKAGVDALGTDFSPLAFVSLARFFVVAEKGGSANDPDYLAAKPYLRKLDYLIAGTSVGGDRSPVRFVVGVK
jgi:hypothetical protein